MKNIKLSVVVFMSMGSMIFAGGNIEAPVEVEETNILVVESQYSNFYAGLALSAVSTRESGSTMNFTSEESGQDRLGNMTFLAGYDFNEYLAVEGRYITTIADEDITEMSGFSIFLKPQYEVSKEFSVYGLAGYGKVDLKHEHSSNVDVDESGFQWGLGANYKVTNEVSIFVDYTSLANDMDGTYLDADSADVDAISIGVTYRF